MSFKKEIIQTKLAPDAVGTYSQGVVFNNTYFFSGQIGIDPSTNTLVEGVQSQLEQILKNIDGLLESCELSRENIIKTSIFLKDMNDFSLINEAYLKYFKEPYPARSCVEVSRLPKDSLIEIEVIAAKS